ncbi:MAG: radical SAM protein [Bacteroidales bacterium]|jgi:MoaA/NifB/PqqE/SkfB family radical SAM enzyme|nr:radical SAM protein [Bacteroidales bacterium]MDD4214425.1 radical SAM protein [Bacteroidales bacterium]
MIKILRKKYQRMPGVIKVFIIRLINVYNKARFVLSWILCKKIKGVYTKELLKDYNDSRPFGPHSLMCFAPFSSMFFSVFGKASPCYATYFSEQLTYPESSIKEIWNGNGFNHIRQQVKNNDLSDICRFCHISMITKNFGSMLSLKYDHYSFYGKKYPSIMEFELENTCNLECVMCSGFLSSSIRKNREKLSPVEKKYDENFVKQLEEYIPYLKVAEFTGGDPLLIDIYYDIWEKIIEKNPACNILVTTNANTMNKRFRDLMERYNKFSFNVSIDSLQKNTYESIRVNGNFEIAMENISFIHNYVNRNKTTMNFLVCPLQLNWSELPEFVRYGNEHGICVYFHHVIKPPQLTLKSMPAEELQKIYQYLKQFEFSENKIHEKTNKANFKNLTEQIHTWHNKASEREKKEKIFSDSLMGMSENEKRFFMRVRDYFENNNEEPGKSEERYCKIVKKINLTLALFPDIDKEIIYERLLLFPVDDGMINIIEMKKERELAEMITTWVM